MSAMFPECLPEKCQNCPPLQSNLEIWRKLTTLQIAILEGQTATSVERYADVLPTDVIENVGQLLEVPLRTFKALDRLKAAQFLVENGMEAYESLGHGIQQQEYTIAGLSELCQGKGPYTIETEFDGIELIVEMCPADFYAASYDFPLTTRVEFRRENKPPNDTF